MSRIKLLTLIILIALCVALLSSCVAMHEHSFGEWETTKEPSCGQDGIQTRACLECDYEEQAQIPAPQHSLLSYVTAPTCTEQGYTTYTCECGYSYNSDYVSPLGHSLNTQKTEPTCTTRGYTHYECKVCDYKFDSDYVEALAHKNSSAQIFYPTVTASGYTQYTCLDCEHVYKENYIAYTDILPHAHTENTEILKKGIDVSYHNGELDWEALKAAGVDYAIIRAGYTTGKDTMFEKNYAGAKAAGIAVGAYFYTYSSTLQGTVKDAYDMLSYLEGKQFEYPIYFDLEEKSDPELHTLDKEHLTQLCVTFIEILQSHGYYCGLYVNHDWLYNILNTNDIKSKFDIWYARYSTAPSEPSPDYKLDWNELALEWSEEKFGKQLGMWQYTEYGYIECFACRFDFNYSYKDYPEIMKKWHLNGF